jgi:hypothetical protein
MGSQRLFTLFQDRAGEWCAAPPGFQNLLRDPIGRGTTRVEAVRDLVSHPEFIHRAKLGEWPLRPGLAAFVEVFAADYVISPNRERPAGISRLSPAVSIGPR